MVAACLLLSLSACGSAPEASSEPNASTEQTEQTTAEAESSEDTTEPAEQPADAETRRQKKPPNQLHPTAACRHWKSL